LTGTLVPALACSLAWFGCATAGGGRIEGDLDAIQQQLWKVQKENAALAEQIVQLQEALRAPAAEADPGPGMAELRMRLGALERDLQALRLRADDSERRLGALAQDLRAARDALETIGRPVPAAGPPGGAGTPTPIPPAREGGVAIGSDDLYRQAYTDYARANYALALQGLEEFLRRAPDSGLADDALYLVGEVHFAQGRYPEAVSAFDQLVRTYPKGDKSASGYLKKGLALLEMNRTADAVIQFQHVVSAFPRSEEARLARERLRALGLKER
jgi:tol-pal system protein YbgF